MAVWDNRQGTNSTSWGHKPGYSGGSSLLGDFDQNAYNEGQYTSTSTASTGLVGTKYFLLDDKPFAFGTKSDFNLSYNRAKERLQFISRDYSPSYVGGYIDRTALEITNKGYLKLKDQGTVSLNLTTETGMLTFTNNKLFISLN